MEICVDHRLRNLISAALIGGCFLSPSLGVAEADNLTSHSDASSEQTLNPNDRPKLNNQALLNRGTALYRDKDFTKSAEAFEELLSRDPLNRLALKGYVLSCQQDQYRCGSVFNKKQPPPPKDICEQAFYEFAQMVSQPDDLIVILYNKPWWFGGADRKLEMAAPAIISHFVTAFMSFHDDPSYAEAPRIILLSVLMDCTMPEYGKRKDPDSVWISDNYEKLFPRSARTAVQTFARNLVKKHNSQVDGL